MTPIRWPSRPALSPIFWSTRFRRRNEGKMREGFMKIDRRAFGQMLAVLGLSTVPAVAQAKTVEVSMRQAPKSRFVPEVVNIAVGDTVKWTNPAFVTHSVTFDPSMAATKDNVALPAGVAAFDSGNLEED